MSDVIKFNTEDAVKLDVVKPQITKIYDLVPENDPILKEVMPEFDFDNPPVDPTVFASALVETCKSNKGYGLSANQCGFRHRVFVMGSGDDYVAFFNPKIISSSGEVHMAEGCLSFPFLGLHITRPAMVNVEYQDFKGVVRTATFSGVSARCFLHEYDHLQGFTFLDKVKPLALQQSLKKRNKLMKLMKKIL